METRASNRKKLILKEEKEKTKDRISDLPDEILELIFSFLPAESIARTSILSKRWRHLWPSYPCLDFSTFQCRIQMDPQNPPNATLIHDLKTEAMEFLPTVLSRNSKIKIFRLTGHISLSCLQNSIRRLVSRGVEELDLDLFLSTDFILPRPLLACHSLRVLSLKANTAGPNFGFQGLINFMFPTSHVVSSSGLQSIQSLSLTHVCFMDYPSASDLFSASTFPLLKKLHLKQCQGIATININCPSLEYLDLDGLKLFGLGVFGTKLEILRVCRCIQFQNDQTWLQILAPRVRIFHLEYNALTGERCFMESFTSLDRGSIYFVSEMMISAASLRCAAYLISMFAFAKHLYLGTLVVELLSKMDGCLPISFNNLVNLELRTGLNRSDIPGIACLLRSCPSLNKLTVEIDYYYRTVNNRWNIDVLDSSNISEEQYWESQTEALKSVQHLKVVEIKVRNNVRKEIYESWIKFVKFLLMYGIMLEEMNLSSKNSDLKDPPLWKRAIGSQIEEFPKASSHVKLIYM